MITLFSYEEFLRPGTHITEYSCPFCCKPIKWTEGALSPFQCPGCMQTLMDLSKVIEKPEWRVSYHLNGEVAVKCGSSNHG